MKRLAAAAMLVIVLSGILTGPVLGSGQSGPVTVFINRHGGTLLEREQLYKGRVGVLYTSAPDGVLYLDWRLLNGLDVGKAVGQTLTTSCCDLPAYSGSGDGTSEWAEATKLVPGTMPASPWIATELRGPNYTTTPNCFRDAFDIAAATLRRRVARYGAQDAAVRSWLTTQTAVFDACSKPEAALPPPMPAAPAWLAADRAYQEAAFALYTGRLADAFQRFRAIGKDGSSPWQSTAFYLSIRVLQRAAFANPTPRIFAATRARIAKLAANPYAYGHGEVRGMSRALAFRDQPDVLFKQLDAELNAKAPVPDLAKGLRDYLALSTRYTPRAELADWMATLRSPERGEALAHAQAQWTATRKVAWLAAALSLARAGDPQAGALAVDAGRVPTDDPGWLTAQYHQLRLTIGSADAAAQRRQVAAVLARDLSESDRNLFRGVRVQLASSLPDMMEFALRHAFCSDSDDLCEGDSWLSADGTLAPGAGKGRYVALGPESKAILDRLPLRMRMAAGEHLPQELRLDLALTNFGRAVQLQDDAAIDALAGELAGRLPEVRREFAAIRAQPPGPAKRFAEFFVLAKMPGISPDLAGYTRPQGSVREWQGAWWDWLIVPPGRSAGSGEPPPASGYNLWSYWGARISDDAVEADLTCYGQCGAGDLPLTLPAFAAAEQPRAKVERARLAFFRADKGATPAGAVSAWAALYDYARAHPRDPRAPEALYWLIRISRFGQIHDRLGYKAFRLLHARYPASPWTRRSPYFFD